MSKIDPAITSGGSYNNRYRSWGVDIERYNPEYTDSDANIEVSWADPPPTTEADCDNTIGAILYKLATGAWVNQTGQLTSQGVGNSKSAQVGALESRTRRWGLSKAEPRRRRLCRSSCAA